MNGLWPSRLRSAHINYLELMAVWKALNHFLPRLQGHHVLVRCDNTTAVAYINRQGGVRSSKLHALAYKLLVWSRRVFLTLRATHVPGLLNRGADLLSRGNPIYGDWRLHPQIVDMLWMRFGQATVDLFASHENYHCPMFFSLKDVDAPLGVDALAHPWPRVLLYAFPPLCLIISTLASAGPVSHSDSTQVAQSTMAGGDNPSVIWRAVAPPPPHGSIVPSERGDLSPAPGQGGSLGLARERTNLSALGISPHVIATIQNVRAVSTRSLYGSKWQVFEGWCDGRGLTSYQCSVPDILCFLQDLLEKGRSFSTIKVYLAAISACHVGFEGSTVGQHPLIRRFMKGARRSLPVVRRSVPEWDLSMVLEALSQYPFEPLGSISLKLLSFKTALLLALASAKRVSELHALSVHPSCTKFSLSGDMVSLKPNPAFMPKCFPAFTSEVLELSAFHPPPFSSPEDERLNALCPVRALQTYINRTSAFRKSDQLFISWAPPHGGNPIF